MIVASSYTSDVHQNKAITADATKLLGNSGYGKTVTNMKHHRDVYFHNRKAAACDINSH